MPDLTNALALAVAGYRRAAERAGASFRCLAADWDPVAEPVATLLNEDGEPLSPGEHEERGAALTLRLDGVIDEFYGVNVRGLVRQIDEARPSSIKVVISSPGGTLRDGIMLYNELRAQARDNGVSITTECRSVAASAATFPMLAGDKRIMDLGSQLMIHEAVMLTIGFGTADELAEQAKKDVAMLRAAGKSMRSIYGNRTKMSGAEIDAAVKAETWYSAEEAVSKGFASELAEDGGAGEDEEIDEAAEAKARELLAQWREQAAADEEARA